MKGLLPLLLTGLGLFPSCRMDAPIVRQQLRVDQAGAAGQFSSTGAGGAAIGGTNSTDPYGETRYDWCLPPIYDPMRAPSYPWCDSPIRMLNPWRWTATILLDRSLSMRKQLPGSKLSKWLSVRNALQTMKDEPTGFLDQWSLMALAVDDTMDESANCTASNYPPSSPTQQSPPKLDASGLLAKFDTLGPDAPTRPTAAALEAAIGDAQRNAALYRGSSTPIVILITDGLPYGCSAGTELERVKELVATVNSPTAVNYTPVFIVQLGDSFDLTKVAEAGKTGTPFVIAGGEIDRQLVRILRRILYPGPTPCERWYGIPRSNAKGATKLDFDIQMDSVYTNTMLYPPHLASAEDCANSPAGGFWVTDAGDDQPYLVGLCPCTCAAMGTDLYTTVTMYCGK